MLPKFLKKIISIYTAIRDTRVIYDTNFDLVTGVVFFSSITIFSRIWFPEGTM